VIFGRLVSKRKFLSRSLAFVAISLGLNLVLANFQSILAQDFYKDKTIRFIVGQAAGGGYDTYTRSIASLHGQIYSRRTDDDRRQHDRRR
jgi:tripartite-type tricarboxylate transporter receptor subunit TctC